MTKPKFAADIEGVRQIGLKDWLAGDGWPVRDADYNAFLHAAFARFEAVGAELADDLRDILDVDYAFFGLLCQLAHWRAVEAHCARSGREIVGGTSAAPYLRPKWDRLANLPLKSAVRWPMLRREAKRWLLNDHLPAVRRAGPLLGRADAWVLGSFSGSHRALASRLGFACDFPAAEDIWNSSAHVAREKEHSALAAAAATLCRSVDTLARERLGGDIDAEAASRAWTARLAQLDGLAAQICTRRLPAAVLIGEMGRPLQRIVGVAARRAGREAYGFHHGNATLDCIRPTLAYTNYPPSTKFVCPTEGIKEQHQCAAERYRPRHAVEFTVIETQRYQELIRAARRAPRAGPVRTVMVLGMAMNAIRYLFATGTFFSHLLHYELRVLDLLRANGYRTVYKMHPETAQFCGSLFKDHADAVAIESFEKVYDQADAYVFGVTSSSTFGFALTTVRPILALDIPGTEWNAATKPLLERRVSLIPADFDDRGWIAFDSTAVLAALGSPKDPDPAFADLMLGSRAGERAAA